MSYVLWVVVAGFVLWTLVRVTGWDRWVPAQQGVAFTPYVALAAVLPILGAVVMRQWLAAGVALACCVTLVACILPRDKGALDTGVDGVRLRVGALNVLWGRADIPAILDMVRAQRLDVLLFIENTPDFDDAVNAAGLKGELPYVESRNHETGHGTAIYSRYPLRHVDLVHPDCRFQMLRGVVELPGQAVDVIAIHTAEPIPRTTKFYYRDFRILDTLPRASDVDGKPLPRAYAGDFNASLDHGVLRRLLKRAGLKDVAASVGKGLVPTWQDFKLPPITIDHVLTDPEVPVTHFEVVHIPKSDHRAVIAELVVRPTA